MLDFFLHDAPAHVITNPNKAFLGEGMQEAVCTKLALQKTANSL